MSVLRAISVLFVLFRLVDVLGAGQPVSVFRTINYAALGRGGGSWGRVAAAVFPAAAAFDGDWLSGWTAPEAAYPVVIHRDLGRVVRANRLRLALGPEVLACPVVYTHNVNVDGTGVGGSLKAANLVAMLDWFVAQGYQPVFFSDLLRFMRSNRLPAGITKPVVIMFATGQRGVYEHAFGPLRERRLKFVATCWDLTGSDERFLTPAQIREMMASGLFEPGIYTKWTTHRFGMDTGPVVGNTTVAFPLYDPETNEFEAPETHEARVDAQVGELVATLHRDYGFAGDIVWEAPSAFHSLTMLRVARRQGVAMLINTGSGLNLYGARALPNLGMVSMSDPVGTLAVRQQGIVAVSGAPPVREYRYEVYISAAAAPASGPGWEGSPDWHKVVFERPGAGVGIDPLYPRAAEKGRAGVVDGLQGSYVKFRHLCVKVLSERENRPAVVNEVDVYYECGSEAELQEVRLRNLEGEGE